MKKENKSELLNATNIVGLIKISDELDLKKIYMGLENTSYEPEQFSGLVYRNETGGTITLFKSGSIICTGIKNQKKVNEVISNLVDKLRFLEIPLYKSYRVQIKNMVFAKTLKQKINLAKVALSFGLENVNYEPEEFPGLIYKTEEPRATFILFESGKIICTGAKSNAQAEAAYKNFEHKLKRYKIIK